MNRPGNMEQAFVWANAADTRWYSSSSGTIELAITFEDAKSCSHSGQCDADVAALMQVPYIAEQLAAIRPDAAREVATESGRNDYGHGPEDMSDHQANLAFVLWMACGDITEEAAR